MSFIKFPKAKWCVFKVSFLSLAILQLYQFHIYMSSTSYTLNHHKPNACAKPLSLHISLIMHSSTDIYVSYLTLLYMGYSYVLSRTNA